jgi:hypothetical protein
MILREASAGQHHASVQVHLDNRTEHAIADVPQLAGLGPPDHAELALQMLHGAARALAPARGWPLEDLDRAAETVRARKYAFTWHGPWKASRNRRYEARGVFWLADHGFGRAVLEIRERGASEDSIVRSPAQDAFCTADGFVRSARTLRWTGDEVSMVPWIGLLRQQTDPMVWGIDRGDAGTVVGEDVAGAPSDQVPEVRVEAREVAAAPNARA